MGVIGGIIAGFASALLSASSYLGSFGFLRIYRSPVRLTVFSQLAMGMVSLPLLYFVFPRELCEKPWEIVGWLLLWALFFTIGQSAFFAAQRSAEPSRISSLLGLKIIVLSVLSIVFTGELIGPWRWVAVLMATCAAMMMNHSGGAPLNRRGIFWLGVTLIFYPLTDLVETQIVNMMPERLGIIRAALTSAIICYATLGVLTLPWLARFRWTNRQFVKSLPFAAFWFMFQIALFSCYGTIGPVFGNVILAGRGLISVGLGVLLMKLHIFGFDAVISRKMWIRRAVAAALMTGGIILYAVTK